MTAQPGATPANCPSAVDVLTHRNGNSRTGANLCETALTTDLVSNHFGKVFEYPVLGQVYAQPLIATQINGVPKAAGPVDLALIATMQDFVYAFDANGGNIDPVSGARQPYWTIHLGDPLPVNRIPKDIGAFLGHYNIEPYVGITSTPVIDPQKTTVFLTAKIAPKTSGQMYCDEEVATSDCPVVNRIFAISLASGSILDSVDINLPPPEKSQTGSPDPHPCAILDNRKPTAQDAGRINMQRPALLLTGSAQQWHIYLGFGSHQDAPCPMYHGMIVRFDFNGRKLTQFGTFMVSQPGDLNPNDSKRLGMGGVWQAGNGLVADPQGNVYFMAGNGGFDAGVRFGSNFVELDPDLKLKSWFAPWNVGFLNDNNRDIDLGASGPVLLPGTQEIVGGGKQGKLYLLKLDALGGKQKFSWPVERTGPPLQVFWAARRWAPEFIYRWIPISLAAFATGYHHIHGAPAFWGEPEADGVLREGSLYVWPERDHLKSFAYRRPPGAVDGAFATSPRKKGPQSGLGMPGGFLSISANSKAAGPAHDHGILWAALPLHDDAWIDIVPGALRAFEIARDGSKLAEVWTSYCAEPDDWFNFSKFVPPTVANGRVYLATFSGSVRVYGQISGNPKHAAAGCDLAAVLKSPNYPEIKDPGGTGYRQTSRATRARPH